MRPMRALLSQMVIPHLLIFLHTSVHNAAFFSPTGAKTLKSVASDYASQSGGRGGSNGLLPIYGVGVAMACLQSLARSIGMCRIRAFLDQPVIPHPLNIFHTPSVYKECCLFLAS